MRIGRYSRDGSRSGSRGGSRTGSKGRSRTKSSSSHGMSPSRSNSGSQSGTKSGAEATTERLSSPGQGSAVGMGSPAVFRAADRQGPNTVERDALVATGPIEHSKSPREAGSTMGGWDGAHAPPIERTDDRLGEVASSRASSTPHGPVGAGRKERRVASIDGRVASLLDQERRAHASLAEAKESLQGLKRDSELLQSAASVRAAL